MEIKELNPSKILAALLLAAAFFAAGCTAAADHAINGVVVPRSAQIRSASALVAADLLEVNRGHTVDILDTLDVPDPSDNTKRERWYRVRGRDKDNTEGWIEARNIMPD